MNVRQWIVWARGLVYATGFVLIWGWLALAARGLDPALGGPLPTVMRPVGAALFAVGAVLALTCIGLFLGPGRGTPAPFDPPREFVASGPYRWTRNPMYLGAAGALLGLGLWWQSPGIVGLSVAFIVIAHLFVMLGEEPGLERRFGTSYQAYLRRVHRWLPRRPRQGVDFLSNYDGKP